VPVRGLLARSLAGLGLVLAAAVAVVGGVALRPGGLVAIGLAGFVAGCLAAGIARETPRATGRSIAEAAWRAAGAIVAVLLVLSGASVLGGAVFTLFLSGTAVAVCTGVWLARTRGGVPGGPALGGAVPAGPSSSLPLAVLSTEELGREWARTTAALAGPLSPGARGAVVARRQETLDELERRDPAGFARWLAGSPLPGSDPAGHLRHGDPA
jgi:hypothetical protein